MWRLNYNKNSPQSLFPIGLLQGIPVSLGGGISRPVFFKLKFSQPSAFPRLAMSKVRL